MRQIDLMIFRKIQPAFILSRNMARRNLTKGQLVIVAAKVLPKAKTAAESGAMKGKKLLEGLRAFPMVSEFALSQARVIVEYAPEFTASWLFNILLVLRCSPIRRASSRGLIKSAPGPF
jgi:hypothetical protein